MKIQITDTPSPQTEKFLLEHPASAITQSNIWTKMQNSLATRAGSFCIVVEENHKPVAAAIIEIHKLFRGKTWLYAPRGPIFNDEKYLPQLFAQITKKARELNAIWFRIDPLTPKTKNFKKFLKKNKFHWAHAQYQPLATRVIDLRQTEDQILANMRQGARRNIRKAEKAKIKIIKYTGKDAVKHIDEYFAMENETTARDNFFGHEKSFYKNFVQNLRENCALFFAADQNGKKIAAAITTFYGLKNEKFEQKLKENPENIAFFPSGSRKAIYYYGVSRTGDKNGAAYLLQWAMIREAKARGCTEYDFLGITPPDEKYPQKHPYHGITAFKQKFGGEILQTIGAWEQIYNWKWFILIITLKKLRRITRKIGFKI